MVRAGEDGELAELLGKLAVLAGRSYQVSELGGGLTNRNYRVTTTDADPVADLVVRVSANESGLLAIDRAAERHNTAMAWKSGVGAPVVEALPADNILVVGFVPGRTLTADDVRDETTVTRIASAVRTLHAGPDFVGTFDFRAIRRRYLDVVVREGFRLPPGYLELAGPVEALEDAMAAGNERLVPCNNDLLAGNFLDDGDRIWIIDYEYGGMNEASFELGNLASESALPAEVMAGLVSSYWGRRDPAKLARARAWSLLARYGWTLWASIQDAVSPIDFDFWDWGMGKYDSAVSELRGQAYTEILNGLAGAP